jgi:hypothetical protein
VLKITRGNSLSSDLRRLYSVAPNCFRHAWLGCRALRDCLRRNARGNVSRDPEGKPNQTASETRKENPVIAKYGKRDRRVTAVGGLALRLAQIVLNGVGDDVTSFIGCGARNTVFSGGRLVRRWDCRPLPFEGVPGWHSSVLESSLCLHSGWTCVRSDSHSIWRQGFYQEATDCFFRNSRRGIAPGVFVYFCHPG